MNCQELYAAEMLAVLLDFFHLALHVRLLEELLVPFSDLLAVEGKEHSMWRFLAEVSH